MLDVLILFISFIVLSWSLFKLILLKIRILLVFAVIHVCLISSKDISKVGWCFFCFFCTVLKDSAKLFVDGVFIGGILLNVGPEHDFDGGFDCLVVGQLFEFIAKGGAVDESFKVVLVLNAEESVDVLDLDIVLACGHHH